MDTTEYWLLYGLAYFAVGILAFLAAALILALAAWMLKHYAFLTNSTKRGRGPVALARAITLGTSILTSVLLLLLGAVLLILHVGGYSIATADHFLRVFTDW